jgi:hypothetical protein
MRTGMCIIVHFVCSLTNFFFFFFWKGAEKPYVAATSVKAMYNTADFLIGQTFPESSGSTSSMVCFHKHGVHFANLCRGTLNMSSDDASALPVAVIEARKPAQAGDGNVFHCKLCPCVYYGKSNINASF